MERIVRMFGPWLALTWGILGTGAWAFNGVRAVTSDAEPSLNAILFALALTVTGVTIGITFSVVAGLLGLGRYPDNAADQESAPFMLPMGVGLLGMMTAPLFDSSPLSTMDWVVLAAGALASGFVLGTVPRVRPRRVPSTALDPAGPPFTASRH